MKIAMVGSGYVGLVSGACFADFGHDVVCIDKDPAKIDSLKAGIMPIYEPGLAELVASNTGLGFAILKAQRFLHTDKIFAGILLIGLVGLVTDQLFRWVHRTAFRWHHLRG